MCKFMYEFLILPRVNYKSRKCRLFHWKVFGLHGCILQSQQKVLTSVWAFLLQLERSCRETGDKAFSGELYILSLVGCTEDPAVRSFIGICYFLTTVLHCLRLHTELAPDALRGRVLTPALRRLACRGRRLGGSGGPGICRSAWCGRCPGSAGSWRAGRGRGPGFWRCCS